MFIFCKINNTPAAHFNRETNQYSALTMWKSKPKHSERINKLFFLFFFSLISCKKELLQWQMNVCVKRKNHNIQATDYSGDCKAESRNVCCDFGFLRTGCVSVKVQIVIWSVCVCGGGWARGGSWDTLLALQFNHCIPREVLTVVLWMPLKLLSKVKWNCSLSRQHWENKGICSWLLINVERDQHKGFIKLYITRVI